jgi:DNA-binding NarL/FixJ family response regulator
MLQSSVHILVLEDFDLFQKLIAPTFRQRPNWSVVGVVGCAADAVRLSKQLRPDLIVIDIDLPELNGINVARRIRRVAPDSKIVFLGESSARLVRETFRLGASSYVIKKDAPLELITAVETVLHGDQFMVSSASPFDLLDKSPLKPGREASEIVATLKSASPRNALTAPSHEVQFYSDDTLVLNGAASFIAAALEAAYSAIVCATEPVRDRLHNVLLGREPGMDDFIQCGNYLALDASDTLSAFMVEDSPNPAKFLGLMGGVIGAAFDTARAQRARVVLFQECSSLLWAQASAEATIQVEQLFNKLADEYDLDILCGYSIAYFDTIEDSHLIQRICAEHSAVRSE